MTERKAIIEALAMALWAKHPRSVSIRKSWASLSWSMKSVYIGAAEEVLRDGRKLGLTFGLRRHPPRKLTPATTLCGPHDRKPRKNP